MLVILPQVVWAVELLQVAIDVAVKLVSVASLLRFIVELPEFPMPSVESTKPCHVDAGAVVCSSSVVMVTYVCFWVIVLDPLFAVFWTVGAVGVCNCCSFGKGGALSLL